MYKVNLYCESIHSESPFTLEIYAGTEEIAAAIAQILSGRYVRVVPTHFDNFNISNTDYTKVD